MATEDYTELEQKVNDIKDDVSELKENVPLYSCDIDEIQQHVKRRVVNILGGKQSEAYRDNSIRRKTVTASAITWLLIPLNVTSPSFALIISIPPYFQSQVLCPVYALTRLAGYQSVVFSNRQRSLYHQ